MSRPPSKALSPQASPVAAQQRSLVPAGMATLLPHAAQQVRYLEGTLLGCLIRWGYQEIIPPTFEYLDVLSAGLEPELIDKSYTLVDRTSDRLLLLRPDATAQIARMVAMGMLGPRTPLRLCYRTTVFRYEPEMEFKTPPKETVDEFQRILEKHQVRVTVRQTAGRDINAACGQLRLDREARI